MLFQNRQAVGYGSQTSALNVARIVAWPGVVIIFSFRNAVVNHHRKERRRCIFGKHPVDVIAHPYFLFHHKMQLFQKSVIEVFKVFKF